MSKTAVAAGDLPPLNTKIVLITQADGDERPKISVTGISMWEAQSMTQAAANWLMEACEMKMDRDYEDTYDL